MFPVMKLFLVLKMFSVTCISADMFSFSTLFEWEPQQNVPVWSFHFSFLNIEYFDFCNFEWLWEIRTENSKGEKKFLYEPEIYIIF